MNQIDDFRAVSRAALRAALLAFCALVLTSAAWAQQPGPAPADATRKEQFLQRDQFIAEALKLESTGKLTEAIAAGEKVLAIDRRLYTQPVEDLAFVLDWLGRVELARENFAQAQGRYQEALDIQTKVFGGEHWKVTDARLALNKAKLMTRLSPRDREQLVTADRRLNEAWKLSEQGRYRDAVAVAEQALAARSAIAGADHRLVGNAASWLGVFAKNAGDYATAELRLRQALNVNTAALGESHPECATALNNLAELYRNMGDYARAEPLYQKALEIRKKVLGETDPSFATSLNNLAALYDDTGDYARAEPLYRQAAEIFKKALGESHPRYAVSLNNLAALYDAMGDNARAEPLYRQAAEILKKALGETHPDYAASLNNLAELYRNTGDYARAEPLCRQALEICKKTLGEAHPNYASSLNNLAGLYDKMGDYARAEPLYRQALEICKKAQGEAHPNYASSLNNLALLYRNTGDYARAEPLYRQALEIRKKAQGEAHPDYASSLSNLAEQYRNMGDDARAEPLYRQALEIRKKALGETHPDYAQNLNDLAALCDAKGDDARVEPLYKQALEITMAVVRQTAGGQSERQQLAMTAGVRFYLDSYLTCCVRAGRGGENIYPFWLAWKGQVSRRERQLHALADQPQLKPRFDQLDQLTGRLARLALATPGQADAVRREIGALSQQKEQLERDLAAASAEFRATLKDPTVADIQAALPADAVLVDFADFESLSVQAAKNDPAKPGVDQGIARPTKTWERRLAAFVVKHTGPVKLVDLGGAKEVTAAIDAWRKDYGASPAGQKAGQLLRARVWQPLVRELADANLVLVSPDGTLGKLPFAALPGDSPGSYLLERCPIAVIPTPASLPELAEAPPARSTSDKLLVVADVDYDHASNASPAAIDPKTQLAASDSPKPATLTRGPARDATAVRWSSLSGTRGEGDTVAKLYSQRFGSKNVMSLVGPAASEETLRRDAPRCEVLHLATHGFFAPPQFRSALHSPDAGGVGRTGGEFLSNQSVTSFHPGVLSGLVLAGANQPPSEQGDGYLTAEEVMSLDLRGARLCVLSACETGLGQVAGGEGLLGLQRAFQVAGARTVVASLWQVHDEATRALMERFYTNLWRSESPLPKLAALREAQLWMLREGGNPSARSARGLDLADDQPSSTEGRLPPYYWAAFVLSGDWR